MQLQTNTTQHRPIPKSIKSPKRVRSRSPKRARSPLTLGFGTSYQVLILIGNRNLLLICSKVTFESHDRIWLVRDYVAGSMFSYTPPGWSFVFFLFCLEFPDYPGPLSFFVFIPRVTCYHIFLCSLSIIVI